jgi:hypothetical protein
MLKDREWPLAHRHSQSVGHIHLVDRRVRAMHPLGPNPRLDLDRTNAVQAARPSPAADFFGELRD